MVDNSPRGVANLNPRVTIDSSNEGDYLILLLTKYKSSGPHALREEDVFYVFLMYDILRGQLRPQGHD